jgi:hypothetical protein
VTGRTIQKFIGLPPIVAYGSSRKVINESKKTC